MKPYDGYNPLIDTIEFDGCNWSQRQCRLETVIQRPQSSGTGVIFLESAIFLSNDVLRTRLLERYRIPHLFWTRLCRRSNGYFGCEDVYNDKSCLLWHNTWFRFEIKQLFKVPTLYRWIILTFFTTWAPTGNITILCFDIDLEFRSAIHNALRSEVNTMVFDIYLIHSTLVTLVLELYDKSVWTLRDCVRDTEMTRMRKPNPETDYPLLHEIARHGSHSSETLLVALETISRMQMQYRSFLEMGSEHAPSVSMGQFLGFQKQLFKGQHARSVSVEARLKNELNLALNLVAQEESAATVRISQAARSDGAAMRAVAVVTLVFLPSTFVSTIFSTTFFALIPSPDGSPASWVVSDHFWIYWAFSVPLTVVTIGTWLWWQQR